MHCDASGERRAWAGRLGRGAHGQVPVDEGEELALEQIEFLNAGAANLCVVAIRAEDVAKGL